jgi:glycerophosphoryl diester phosphodiesterase
MATANPQYGWIGIKACTLALSIFTSFGTSTRSSPSVTMNSLLALALAASSLAHPTPSYPTKDDYLVSLGPRPYYIMNNMTDSPLKRKLQSCENKPVKVSGFSIGHRGGGTLQFPEETVISQDAGARMGAGILECDVAFTSDRALVCRHDLCDLHTTTNILTKPELAKKCTKPFTPANGTTPASALCCTSDITVAECMLIYLGINQPS